MMLSLFRPARKNHRTMAEALKQLHNLNLQNFPPENHLKTYKERAFKNYEKGSSI